jgi:hypothetical protein
MKTYGGMALFPRILFPVLDGCEGHLPGRITAEIRTLTASWIGAWVVVYRRGDSFSPLGIELRSLVRSTRCQVTIPTELSHLSPLTESRDSLLEPQVQLLLHKWPAIGPYSKPVWFTPHIHILFVGLFHYCKFRCFYGAVTLCCLVCGCQPSGRTLVSLYKITRYHNPA